MNEGYTVIADRYAYSGVVYTAAKGYNIDWCKQPDIGLPRPDLIILLDLPTEISMSRGEFGSERYEQLNMQSSVRLGYRMLMECEPEEICGTRKIWKLIDATRSKEEIEIEVLNAAIEVQSLVLHDSIDELWIDSLNISSYCV